MMGEYEERTRILKIIKDERDDFKRSAERPNNPASRVSAQRAIVEVLDRLISEIEDEDVYEVDV